MRWPQSTISTSMHIPMPVKDRAPRCRERPGEQVALTPLGWPRTSSSNLHDRLGRKFKFRVYVLRDAEEQPGTLGGIPLGPQGGSPQVLSHQQSPRHRFPEGVSTHQSIPLRRDAPAPRMPLARLARQSLRGNLLGPWLPMENRMGDLRGATARMVRVSKVFGKPAACRRVLDSCGCRSSGPHLLRCSFGTIAEMIRWGIRRSRCAGEGAWGGSRTRCRGGTRRRRRGRRWRGGRGRCCRRCLWRGPRRGSSRSCGV